MLTWSSGGGGQVWGARASDHRAAGGHRPRGRCGQAAQARIRGVREVRRRLRGGVLLSAHFLLCPRLQSSLRCRSLSFVVVLVLVCSTPVLREGAIGAGRALCRAAAVDRSENIRLRQGGARSPGTPHQHIRPGAGALHRPVCAKFTGVPGDERRSRWPRTSPAERRSSARSNQVEKGPFHRLKLQYHLDLPMSFLDLPLPFRLK